MATNIIQVRAAVSKKRKGGSKSKAQKQGSKNKKKQKDNGLDGNEEKQKANGHDEKAGQHDSKDSAANAVGDEEEDEEEDEGEDDPFDDGFDSKPYARNVWYVKILAVGIAEIAWVGKDDVASRWFVPFVLPGDWLLLDDQRTHNGIPTATKQEPKDITPEHALATMHIDRSVFCLHRCKWKNEQNWSDMKTDEWKQLRNCKVIDVCVAHENAKCNLPGCSDKTKWIPYHLHSRSNGYYALHDRYTGYYPEF